MPDFTRSMGAKVAEDAAKSRRGGPEFFGVKEGNQVFVRPLTDISGLITVQVHVAPTREGPKGAQNWPAQMSAVCQNDSIFVERIEDDKPIYEAGYGHCYIHERMQDVKGKYGGSVAKPRAQTWGLFVLREMVTDNGRPVGFQDVMEEYTDSEGAKHQIPKIVIASQSYTNFWGQFVSAAFMTGSICCFDFAVKRTSSTDYEISPGRETRDHAPGTTSWERYERALALRGLSVEQVIVDQASAKYYGRFFDPSVPFDEEESGPAAESGSAPAAGEISQEQAEETRARMAAAFGSTRTT